MDNTQVFISLGSNMGDRLLYLQMACDMIGAHCGLIINESSVYETEPWGFESQMSFYNQVVHISTNLDPVQLIGKLLNIEMDLGRSRSAEGYQSRTIDIDILYYDALVLNQPALIIPHPRLHLRRFVLEPLCEIASDYRHPILKQTNSDLLKLLDDTLSVCVICSANE
jgi:2-amino-4-hydroxy-6-hydroxymethyldihydropteridine diphosphokinase